MPNSSLRLGLLVPTAQHFVRREYLLYDANSLIADIGGYLGLLLGYSILSVFHQLASTCKIAED